MEAIGGISGQNRVNSPSTADQKVIDLSVDLLVARCGTTFGKGFRLIAIRQRLYVQIAGRKVPLYLNYDAGPAVVLERAMLLRSFLARPAVGFSTAAWRRACGMAPGATGKARGGRRPRPELDEVVAKWKRLKLAEGVSEATIERHYLAHLRRLDPFDPFSDESLLRVIERTSPRSPTRRRVVAFLRRLVALCGQEWNGALLDPLQNSGRAVSHRAQSFFLDTEIEAMLAPDSPLSDPWRRVVTLMAVYGLRPWEAWLAEPCQERAHCAWIPAGKTNRHGTTQPRQAPAFHPEWLEVLGVGRLWQVPLPPLSSASVAGARTNQTLRRCGLATLERHTSYGLRHAYARRLHSPRYRVTDAHAALFMGHTVAAHHKAYRDWLGGESPVDLY